MNRNWIRLPLKGADNVRELGGLPAMDGRQTAWHRFLRADQLAGLTAEDMELLLSYGVKTVIDLRSASEAAVHPDSPQLLKHVEYYRIPFMEADLSPQGQARLADIPQDLGVMYLALLKKKEVIRQLFTRMELAPEGCILFHCTAGKDRTGVLALMLLMLAGADRQDCLTNYIQSFINLTRNERFTQLSQNGYHSLIRSDAEDITAPYDYIESFPQGIRGFLWDCGVSASCMEHVKERCLA